MDETNPTARALLCLEVLQDRPGVTAAELARSLDVSERAARRYVAILREAGIPVDSVRGRYGGYRLGRGLRLPPIRFAESEALAVVMAVLDGHHDAADSDTAVGAALGKIVRALPESVARQAEQVRHHAVVAPDRAAARPNPDITGELVRARAALVRVRLAYESESGKQWSPEVDPWTVVVRNGRWYLLCWDHGPGDRRAYRIDRVRAVEHLAVGFEPPTLADPVAELETHLGIGWEFEVQVAIEASFEDAGRWVPRVLGRLVPVDEDRCRLIGSTSNPRWYAAELARIPLSYKVIHGEEVRACVRELADRLLAASAV